ncbi:MAG: transglutaminase family protein [Mycobacteriales bacterium]
MSHLPSGRQPLPHPAQPALFVVVACALGIFPLAAVFERWTFYPPAVVAVVLVVAGAELVRKLRLPAWLGPFASTALILAYLTASYGRRAARLWFVPSLRSLAAIDATARAGFREIRLFAAPVPTTSGLVLITVVGVGLVTLVTYLFAVILERPAAAGLPLLAVFTVATSVAPHGVSASGFLGALCGYLLLLASEGHTRALRWGRLVQPPEGPERIRVPHLGLRIGVVTAVAALALPSLLPFVHSHRLAHPNGGSGTSGVVVTTYNPILSLGQDLNSSVARPLLSVRSTDPTPGYLQMTTLDTFTANSWVASRDLQAGNSARVSAGLPTPQIADVPVRKIRDKITLEGNLDVHWLPVPYPATSVRVSGDWRYDPNFATVFSASDTTLGVHHYQVSALALSPTAADITKAATSAKARRPPAGYLQLPAGLPPEIAAIAREVTAGSHGELAQAIALQDYLDSSQFTYNTSVADADGESALLSFLTVTHSGYCVQFASAMAVLARTLGIPARVAIGFTAGTKQRNGSWLITTHDAHAWPQLYFPGVGWLRFEPTPRADGQAFTPAYAAGPAGGGSGASNSAKAPSTLPTPAPNPNSALSKVRPHGAGLGTRARHARQARQRGQDWPGLVALLALLAAAISPALLRARLRRRRRRAPPGRARVEALWAELADSAVDLGLAWPAAASPRRAAATLTASANFPRAGRQLVAELCQSVERSRYSGHSDQLVDPTARLDQLLGLLRRRASLESRLRARLLPPSTLKRLREARPTARQRFRATGRVAPSGAASAPPDEPLPTSSDAVTSIGAAASL